MKDALDRFLCCHPRLYLEVLRATRRGSVEKRAFLSLVRAGDVVLDVGANRGHFTRLFARLVGSTGSVHAFEPGPRAFAMLEDVINRAGLRNCTLNHCALAEAAGATILHLPGDDDGQASLRTHRHGSWQAAVHVQHYECRVTTLDAYAAALTRFDFLKCDAEGAELSIVRGGREVLTRHLPLLWLESNPAWTCDFGYAPPELLTELRRLGYDTFFSAGAHVEPLAETHLSNDVNLLCACARHHKDRLAGIAAIGHGIPGP